MTAKPESRFLAAARSRRLKSRRFPGPGRFPHIFMIPRVDRRSGALSQYALAPMRSFAGFAPRTMSSMNSGTILRCWAGVPFMILARANFAGWRTVVVHTCVEIKIFRRSC